MIAARSARGLLALLTVSMSSCDAQRGAAGDSGVPEPESCAPCRIEVGPAIELRADSEGGTIPNTAFFVGRASSGRIYAGYNTYFGELFVHEADGSFTGERIGGEGLGPGEFRRILNARTGDDAMHVYDLTLQKITSLDANTHDPIRTIPVPRHADLFVLPDGRMVLSGAIATSDAAGYPLHILDERGVRQYSFGLEAGATRPDPITLARRSDLQPGLSQHLQPVTDTTFWAVPRNEYRLDLWHVDGRRLRTLRAERDWFEPWTERISRSRDLPPSPNVTDIVVGPDGLIRVLLHRATDDWQAAISDETNPEGAVRLRRDRPYLVAVLEIIDPEETAVIARHAFPHSLWGFAGPGAVWRTWVDEAGVPHAELIPVRLRGRQ